MAGFYVVGVDINPQPRYCGDEFYQADAMTFPVEGFDFAWASTPCEQFSIHGMKCFHPNPKYPCEGIRLFNGTRERLEESGIDYVMENVRSAQKFVGPSVNHCGPFHFWGNTVPALFPESLYKVKKGMKLGGSGFKDMSPEERRDARRRDPMQACSSKSKLRKELTASVAMIPVEICEYIGKQAIQLIRGENEKTNRINRPASLSDQNQD